jgi:hypothetical protein
MGFRNWRQKSQYMTNNHERGQGSSLALVPAEKEEDEG